MSLEIIMGGMFSGKSTELIRRVRRHVVIGDRVLIVNSDRDTRSDKSVVRTHDAEVAACEKVARLSDLEYEMYDVVAVDEAQFFTGLRDFVEHALGLGKRVILAGLDGDFQQRPFGEIFSVLPMADSVLKLCALCMGCRDGTPGPFTKRCVESTAQELVGGSESYKAVCRKCL
jgi:thymidine kinase